MTSESVVRKGYPRGCDLAVGAARNHSRGYILESKDIS